MFSIPREGSLPICDQQFVRRSPASIRTVSPMINICCHTHRRNWRKRYPSSESWNEFLTSPTPFYFCINCNAISSLEFFSISWRIVSFTRCWPPWHCRWERFPRAWQRVTPRPPWIPSWTTNRLTFISPPTTTRGNVSRIIFTRDNTPSPPPPRFKYGA